jgi:hypothetical protein
MSEEYSVGYSEGYQAGWNAAMDTTPPAPSPVPLIQAWRDSAQWLRNNYQDHPNVASLCDAMVEYGSKQALAPAPVPLTDGEYFEIGQRHWLTSTKIELIHAEIEAKRKEKNT